MAGPPPQANPLYKQAQRVEKARRAYELAVSGYATRVIAETMTAEGYDGCQSQQTVANLIKAYSKDVILPSATEYAKYQYERLQRELTKLDGLEAHMETVLARFHITVNQGKIIYDPSIVGDVPLRDDGPEMAAVGRMIDILKSRVTIEERISKLLGTDAVVKTTHEHVTVDETDKALRDLVTEMNATEVAPQRTDA